MRTRTTRDADLTREQYVALAEFRYALRRFLAFSQTAAADVGLPSQQHQALLAIAGHVGPDPPGTGMIAERLVITPHAAAELVARMGASGLVTKQAASQDRRRVELTLTPRARKLLRHLSRLHLDELEKLAHPLRETLRNAVDTASEI